MKWRRKSYARPDLGEGHLALGLYYYWAEANYDKALEEFTSRLRLPNDSDVGYFAAAIDGARDGG
jgi:lipoprotein NlpI